MELTCASLQAASRGRCDSLDARRRSTSLRHTVGSDTIELYPTDDRGVGAEALDTRAGAFVFPEGGWVGAGRLIRQTYPPFPNIQPRGTI